MEDLKLELFDEIAKAKDSMNIASIKYETDVIYDTLEETANMATKDETDRKMMLISSVYIAISSYYVNPNLEVKQRIPLIKGMCFYNAIMSMNRDELNNKSPKNQIMFCLEQMDSIIETEETSLSLEDEHYFRLGISIAANLNDKSKQK